MKTRFEVEIGFYDKHNPGCRNSPDPMVRLHGKCGCKKCKSIRKRWQQFLAPIDNPLRGVNNMASINICDRCPSMVKGVALGAVQVRTSGDYETAETLNFELCPACIQEIIALLDMTPSEADRPRRAFDKPFTRKPELDVVDAATAEQLAAALFEKLMNERQEKKQIEAE